MDRTSAAQRVLVVEDDALIAMEVEDALKDAGYEVCGVAASEQEAIEIARSTHPDLAVVDVKLAPGDGRNVARDLGGRFKTTILMATSENPESLHGIGAKGVLPKPYSSHHVAPALEAVKAIAKGDDPGPLPDHMKRLR